VKEIDDYEYDISEDRMILVRSYAEFKHTTAQSMARQWMSKSKDLKEDLVLLSWGIFSNYEKDKGHYENGFIILQSREDLDDGEYIETTEVLQWEPQEYKEARTLFLSILSEVYEETKVEVVDNRPTTGRVIIRTREAIREFFGNNEKIIQVEQEQEEFPLTHFAW